MFLEPNDGYALNSLLNSLKNDNPFYKRLLNNVCTFNDIELIEKQDLIRSQNDFPPFGDYTSSFEIDQIYRTSGTTNIPLLVTLSRNDVERITNIGKECFQHSHMGEIGKDEIVINCMNLSLWAGGFLDSQAINKTGVTVLNFGVGNTTELIKLITHLSKKYKVSIHSTPSYLPILEKRYFEITGTSPSNLNMHAFYLGGESGLENQNFRKKLMNVWGCNIYNANYGMSEVCSIMASASDDNRLMFAKSFIDNFYLELYSEKKYVSVVNATEELEGELIISSRFNESQPLLRYNTKERLKISGNDSGDIYFKISGRSDDMIIVKGINLFPEQIRCILVNYKEVTGFFKILVQKRDVIEKIDIVCSVKPDQNVDKISLAQKISNHIRDELTVKADIFFSEEIGLGNNKTKVVEFY